MSMEDPKQRQSLEIARRIAELMSEHGIPTHQQGALLVQLCGLSTSQARRKLLGASWSFIEVLTVARHFGVSLDSLFPVEGAGAVVNELFGNNLPMMQEGVFHLGTGRLPAEVRLGMRLFVAPADETLVAVQLPDGLHAGDYGSLRALCADAPIFMAEEILLTPPEKQLIHVAILDDDQAACEALAEWFSAAGYAAKGFTTGQRLLQSGLQGHDIFVIDFLLSGSDSARDVITQIRQELPLAPIALLTGKLKDGLVSEADLAQLMRTMNVVFFEKPVRPSVLAAALQNSLDQLALNKIRGDVS